MAEIAVLGELSRTSFSKSARRELEFQIALSVHLVVGGESRVCDQLSVSGRARSALLP